MNNGPIWNKTFCPDSMKKKFCFKTNADAELYIKHIYEQSGKTLSSYFCGCCNAWHLTSLPIGVYKRKIVKTSKNGSTSKKKYR